LEKKIFFQKKAVLPKHTPTFNLQTMSESKKRSFDDESASESSKLLRIAYKYADAWESLKENGYAVIENVVSLEQCHKTYEAIKRHLREAGVDVDSPKLKMSSYPNSHGIVQHLEIGQLQEVWEIRMLESILEIFEEMWGDSDLLSSTDGVCWMPSHYRGLDRSWLHTDQSHKKTERQCVQGYVNLLTSHDEASGSLYVVPGSHLLHAEFAKKFPAAAENGKDWYKFNEEELASFGAKPIRVHGGVGSLVLWDSRLAHSAIPPARNVEARERCVVYVCYQPRALCSKKNLEKKRAIFENFRMTTHWPASKVEMFGVKWRTYGAEIIVKTPARNRVENQKMLEIAGCVPMTSQERRVRCSALAFHN
jgi:ectoine hydroxylase-related dioxygenase (phytanoyl-CoA dioxygenase family)